MRKMMMALVGGLSVSGWMATAQDVNTDIDSDGNGSYSLEELQVDNHEVTEEAFNEADSDDDGAVDPAEYHAAIDAAIICPPRTRRRTSTAWRAPEELLERPRFCLGADALKADRNESMRKHALYALGLALAARPPMLRTPTLR